MTQIELTSEEKNLLAQTLECSLSELDVEIHRTDNHEFKKMLQRRREVLAGLLGKTGEPACAETLAAR